MVSSAETILKLHRFLAGCVSKISQMPIVLIPIHFDRDPIDHIPSCQRSVVIRTFVTNDFMTGIPATPGKHLPLEVRGVTEAMAEIPVNLEFCNFLGGSWKTPGEKVVLPVLLEFSHLDLFFENHSVL